MGIMEGKIV